MFVTWVSSLAVPPLQLLILFDYVHYEHSAYPRLVYRQSLAVIPSFYKHFPDIHEEYLILNHTT